MAVDVAYPRSTPSYHTRALPDRSSHDRRHTTGTYQRERIPAYPPAHSNPRRFTTGSSHVPSLSQFEVDNGHKSGRRISINSSADRRVHFSRSILVKEIPGRRSGKQRTIVNPTLEKRLKGYDMCLPPRCSAPELSEPAVLPAQRRLRITCDLIPWRILIENDKGVTCAQVVTALYNTLQHRILPDDWATRSTKQKDCITQAFMRRCRQAKSFGRSEKEEQSKGVRRVDWLMRQTVFMGLSPTFDNDDTFILSLGPHAS